MEDEKDRKERKSHHQEFGDACVFVCVFDEVFVCVLIVDELMIAINCVYWLIIYHPEDAP